MMPSLDADCTWKVSARERCMASDVNRGVREQVAER
jgi:hypothetical protein